MVNNSKAINVFKKDCDTWILRTLKVYMTTNFAPQPKRKKSNILVHF